MKKLYSLLKRLLLFLVLWLVLSGGTAHGPVLAVLAVLAATAFSLSLWSPGALRLRLLGFLPLALYFLGASVQGGVDIARRALSPSMPLEPALLQFESKLSSEAGVVLLVWMISLMPGTASVGLEHGRHLTVHVIDRARYGEESLRQLEHKVSRFIESRATP
jgi:multicomponent Na+:H+ antiporter subunit E